MSKCEDSFQRIQRLREQQAKLIEAKMKLRGLGTPEIEEGIKNKKGSSIPQSQPVNFKQQLRTNPELVVRDYAFLSKSLLETSQELNPRNWQFLNRDVEGAAKAIAEHMGNGMTGERVLNLLSADDRFGGLAEATARVRYLHDTAKNAYLQDLEQYVEFMRGNPGVSIPEEMTQKSFTRYQVALMTERHYDHVRNEWSAMGRAMQGKNADAVMALADEAEMGRKMLDGDLPDLQTQFEQIKNTKPNDLEPNDPYTKFRGAIDKAATNPDEAMLQTELELVSIRAEGVDPRKRLDPSLRRGRISTLTNLLMKDSQLFNERTQGLNVGSNVAMAFYGPYRTMWEGVLQEPVGTPFMKKVLDNFQDTWKGYGAAYEAVRASGKEVFLDAWQGNGKQIFYASNVESYGRFAEPVQQRIAELQEIMNRPAVNFLSMVNPERYRARLHAGFRLWLYDLTKHPAALRPGLTALAATDNLGGFFFHHFHSRANLEAKARRDGVQMDLFDRRSLDEWVEQEYQKQFYRAKVDDDQIAAYRREQGIPPELADDTEIESLILEERVRKTYGAPIPDNPIAREAGAFSEQMRFQNKPNDQNLGQGIYQGINSARRRYPVADLLVPYLQSPFMGASLDFSMTGIGPGVDLVRHLTGNRKLSPDEMRRTKANLIVAGHIWATFAGLSASGLIVGNGPINPEERREWLTDLKKQGKKPNSIAGIQLLGGVPLISTLFLLEDLRYAMETSLVSKHDQQTLGNAALGVLAGHLTRSTALGQVGQLFEILYGDPTQSGRTASNIASYIGSGQIPGIGLIRSAERLSNSRAGNLYRERPWTAAEEELFDRGVLQKMESDLREMAYGTSGLFGALGGQYRDNDWLGDKIRLPWGFGLARYLEHRFFPHLHPDDKVYTELRGLDMLNPPEPLMTRTLEGVPMSDELQKEYNDTYGRTQGDMAPVARMKLAGASPTFTVKLTTPIDLKDGMRINKSTNLLSLDLSIFLGKHVKGKTFHEAALSLINDPLYQSMQGTESLSGDRTVRDQPKGERRRAPAVKMMAALKSYYHLLTLDALGASESPAATEWRDRRNMLSVQQQQSELEKLKDFQGVLGGAQ